MPISNYYLIQLSEKFAFYAINQINTKFLSVQFVKKYNYGTLVAKTFSMTEVLVSFGFLNKNKSIARI